MSKHTEQLDTVVRAAVRYEIDRDLHDERRALEAKDADDARQLADTLLDAGDRVSGNGDELAARIAKKTLREARQDTIGYINFPFDGHTLAPTTLTTRDAFLLLYACRLRAQREFQA